MLKQGTNQMIRFFVYSNLKSWLQEGDNSKDIGAVRTFLIGGVAGAASVFGNTPVDVVKTRMQVRCGTQKHACRHVCRLYYILYLNLFNYALDIELKVFICQN
jgi:hypothetical protein